MRAPPTSARRGGPAGVLALAAVLLGACASGAPRADASAAVPPPMTAPASAPPSTATAARPSPPAAPSPSPGASRPGASSAPSAAPGPAPYCAIADVLTAFRSYDAPERTILDKTYRLDESYVPPDLVPVAQAGFAGSPYRVRAIVAADLAALRSAAASAGIPLVLWSAYRSYADQVATFDGWVATSGLEEALRASARPGHSEHQLGTAIDIGSPGTAPWDDPAFGETAAGRWLAANGPAFGFVVSYPAGREDVTCYVYEPWHLRWVGRGTASAVIASGLTLRELQGR